MFTVVGPEFVFEHDASPYRYLPGVYRDVYIHAPLVVVDSQYQSLLFIEEVLEVARDDSRCGLRELRSGLVPSLADLMMEKQVG